MIFDYQNPPEDYANVELLARRSFRLGVLISGVIFLIWVILQMDFTLYGLAFYFVFIFLGVSAQAKHGTDVLEGLRQYSRREVLNAWKGIPSRIKKYFIATKRYPANTKGFPLWDVDFEGFFMVFFLIVFIYLPFVVIPVLIFGLVNAVLMSYATLLNLISIQANKLILGKDDQNDRTFNTLRALLYTVVFVGLIYLSIELVRLSPLLIRGQLRPHALPGW